MNQACMLWPPAWPTACDFSYPFSYYCVSLNKHMDHFVS
jgi:hypothetical protein